MNDKIKDLLKLIQDNPTLEILPMVNSDCVGGDDYSSWSAEWGKSEVDECYSEDERIYFKSTDYDELVEDYMNDVNADEFKNDEEIQKYAEKLVDKLDWTRAIVVHINPL